VLMCPLVDQRPRGRGVVACVDGDPASAQVVSAALTWADRLGQPPVVLTVAEDGPRPVDGEPVRRRFGPDGDVDGALEELVAPFRSDGRDVATLALYDPLSPWDGLYRHLNAHPAQLVVAGSHVLTGMPRVVDGSVAASIVRHSPSPVLMTRREDG
jgi:nucleotide-binding universal stress UspA family protein